MEHRPEYKEETDFRDLLRQPRRLFGYTYLYVLAVVLALGVLYVWNLTEMGKNAVIPALPDSSAAVTDIPVQAPLSIPPVDVQQAARTTTEAVARGRDLFRANCISCHGEDGRGDGPSAATMNPKPRNFHQGTGWTNGTRISELYRTLQEGIVRNGMASYSYIPPADRFALIHYVRTFTPSPGQDTPQELQSLETAYQLSKGSTTPGQIPIRRAARLVAAEHASQEMLAESLQKSLERAMMGDALLSRTIGKSSTAARAIIGSPVLLASADSFRRGLAGDPVALGFRAATIRLSGEDITRLHARLAQLATAAMGKVTP